MGDEIVQKQATVEQIIKDHMAGVGGYAIAEKYGMDTDKVKQIINEANDAGKFIPDGVRPSADFSDDEPVKPLVEGVNPDAKSETTAKK